MKTPSSTVTPWYTSARFWIFFAGSGPKFEDAKLTALKPGSIIVIPAGAPHYGWAKEGEVILQEAGLGPSGTSRWCRNRSAS